MSTKNTPKTNLALRELKLMQQTLQFGFRFVRCRCINVAQLFLAPVFRLQPHDERLKQSKRHCKARTCAYLSKRQQLLCQFILQSVVESRVHGEHTSAMTLDNLSKTHNARRQNVSTSHISPGVACLFQGELCHSGRLPLLGRGLPRTHGVLPWSLLWCKRECWQR